MNIKKSMKTAMSISLSVTLLSAGLMLFGGPTEHASANAAVLPTLTKTTAFTTNTINLNQLFANSNSLIKQALNDASCSQGVTAANGQTKPYQLIFKLPTQQQVQVQQPVQQQPAQQQPTKPVQQPIQQVVVQQPTAQAPAQSAKPVQQPTNTANQQTNSASAQQVLNLVNQNRQQAGLSALTLDSNLSNMATVKAQDMINNNYFDHNSPTYGSPFDMMQKFNIAYGYAGENIAKGQTSADQVMNDWMNSPGHRANILNGSYKKIGIGYYNGAWVQEFTD